MEVSLLTIQLNTRVVVWCTEKRHGLHRIICRMLLLLVGSIKGGGTAG